MHVERFLEQLAEWARARDDVRGASPEPLLRAVLEDSDAMGIVRRGYRIVHDEVGLSVTSAV
jgi:hypothetical protein